MKLTIELVPKTAWYSNVRSMVSKANWDVLRREAYKKSNYKCEVCGGVGQKHPVECHEIWKYDDKARIQTLVGLTALCPACHEVKHIGLASMRGRRKETVNHLLEINQWTEDQAESYIEEQYLLWMARSQYSWQVDLTWLEDRGINYKKDQRKF